MNSFDGTRELGQYLGDFAVFHPLGDRFGPVCLGQDVTRHPGLARMAFPGGEASRHDGRCTLPKQS